MKSKQLVVLVCLFLLVCCQWGFGLNVVRKDPTGFSAQGYGLITDSYGSDGPLNPSKWDPNNVQIDSWNDLYLSTYYSYGYGSSGGSFGSFEHEPGVIMVDVHMSSSAYATSNDNLSDSTVWVQAETLTNGVTHGYFMEIAATEAGEQVGDLVHVNLTFSIYASFTGTNGSAQLAGSNGMDHLAVTLNQTTPLWPGSPDPAHEIWTLPNGIYTSDVYDNYYHSFDAQIGDVIGVFAFVKSQAEVTGVGESYVNCNPSFYFTIALDTNPMDFNSDGYVNLEDFARFAQEWLWVRPGR